jgi:DNA replication protein
LKEAEETYPAEWIADAMRIAVEKNKRVWRYVAAILERWNREGRDVEKAKPKDRRDAAETRQRYVEGEFSDFIEH